MRIRISSGLVMSVVVILIGLEYSSAKCDQGNLGKKEDKNVFLQTDTRFLQGRKMLQEIAGKPAYIPGKIKPSDLDNSLPEVQTLESMSDVSKPDASIAKEEDEKRTFLEAADEVENLMRKDYKGMQAKRKPPIHKHEPQD